MRFHTDRIKLILQRPYETAQGRVSSQTNVILTVEDEGLEGFGEATGGEAAAVEKTLSEMGQFVLPDVFELEETLAGLAKRFPACSFELSAVDMALHDLIGKKLGLPVYKYLGLSAGEAKKTSYTVAVDSAEKAAERVAEAKDYSTLRIKLGRGEDDLKIARALRKATEASLRADASGGWKFKEAVDKMKTLADLGFELVEQPLAPDDIKGHAKLREKGILPILLDESVNMSADLPAVAAACDGVVVKLAKCGGIREAYRMIAVARALGLKVMLGCMIESSIGITAAAHLSPLADYLDLDGNLVVGNDPYRGVISAFGEMLLPDRAGLGLVDAYEAHEWHD